MKQIPIKNIQIKKAGVRGFHIMIPPVLINRTGLLQANKKYDILIIDRETNEVVPTKSVISDIYTFRFIPTSEWRIPYIFGDEVGFIPSLFG